MDGPNATLGNQSALDPASESADALATLFWWMVGGSILVWLIVIGLAVYAVFVKPSKAHDPGKTVFWIIGGGVAFPTVVLAGLLAYGLWMLPDLMARAPEGSLRVHVSGEMWWWRVEYELPDGRRFRSDNEIRLPVGEPVQFVLTSGDVIHSFWIPALGGKVDMIPGRTSHLALEPTRVGRFRGVCAEFCGASHALMAFDVVVTERADFDEWAERQGEVERKPGSIGEQFALGAEVFSKSGCGACHAVDGRAQDGVVGPDLTRFGSRLSLGAGTLPNDSGSRRRWLVETDVVKPGVLMPHYGHLSDEEIAALVGYLGGLR
ncbi:MAG: cytochrome c oxidase subunit II [Chthoniobacterales bacterium]